MQIKTRNKKFEKSLENAIEIEKVSFADRDARRYFETQKAYVAFEDSWFALIQGIRLNPRLHRKKIYFSDHPYQSESLVVYNHLCGNITEFVNLLSSLLIKLNKKKAVWKNADPMNLSLLHHYGFECYEDEETWDDQTKYDDQTYPQYICSLKQISTLEGPCFGQIRQQSRAVERFYKDGLVFENYQKKHKKDCENLAIAISKEIGEAKELSSTSVAKANLLYLTYTPDNSFVLRYNGEMLSFIAFDVRDNIANFNCLIYQRNPKYISTYTMVRAAQELYKIGVEELNLSGSEFKSLDHWKNKFNPLRKIERVHLNLLRRRDHEFISNGE